MINRFLKRRQLNPVVFSFVFLVFTLVLYLMLIPPFQNPDEVQHFGEILSQLYPEIEHQTIEKDILQLLWKYKWFVFVGMGQPDHPPNSLKSIKYLQGYELGSFRQNNSTTFFHDVYGFLLSPFKNANILLLFYLARLLSLLFTFVTLIFIYHCMKSEFHEDILPLFCFFYMIPQFLIIGISVNYEIFSTLFGTIFFVALIKIRRKFFFKWFVALNIGLFGSLISKNGGGIFFIFLVLTLIIIKFDIKKIFYSILVLNGIFIVFSWVNYLLPGKMYVLYKNVFAGINQCSQTLSATGDSFNFFEFVLVIFKSFYAKLGWMAYELEWFWYGLFFMFVLLSVFGYLLLNRRKGELRFFIFTMIIFSIQIMASWYYYGLRGILAQGRYMYPFIILFFYVSISGLSKLDFRFFKQKMIFLKTVGVINILANLYIIIFKIIPIFYLAFRSPHKGI